MIMKLASCAATLLVNACEQGIRSWPGTRQDHFLGATRYYASAIFPNPQVSLTKTSAFLPNSHFPAVRGLSSKSRWNREAALAKIEAPRGSGGTGRRARLRILWPKGRGGSNPSFRTNTLLSL